MTAKKPNARRGNDKSFYNQKRPKVPTWKKLFISRVVHQCPNYWKWIFQDLKLTSGISQEITLQRTKLESLVIVWHGSRLEISKQRRYVELMYDNCIHLLPNYQAGNCWVIVQVVVNALFAIASKLPKQCHLF